VSGPGGGIRRLLEAVASGRAEALDGRGVNTSYRVASGGRSLSVKVHCAERSTEAEERRITVADRVLRGAEWYPAVMELGFAPGGRLVVVRPYAEGAPPGDARRELPRLARILGALAGRARGAAVPGGLSGDYATPWLDDGDRERALVAPALDGRWPVAARAVAVHSAVLPVSARRLTRPGAPVVHHGDLHGRNLVVGPGGALTVIDWDEAGFAERPSDAAKALWLSCRRGRGDFVLDPVAVGDFLDGLWLRLRLPYGDAADLAALGALWFLPRSGHLELLGRRDPGHVSWYLGWVSRFWSGYGRNLDLIARTAAERETAARGG
jgi:Ser/Thr protein kinase RdoA (MazF antagonist)